MFMSGEHALAESAGENILRRRAMMMGGVMGGCSAFDAMSSMSPGHQHHDNKRGLSTLKKDITELRAMTDGIFEDPLVGDIDRHVRPVCA